MVDLLKQAELSNQATKSAARENADALIGLETTPSGPPPPSQAVSQGSGLSSTSSVPTGSVAPPVEEPSFLSDLASIPKQIIAGGAQGLVEQAVFARDVSEFAGFHEKAAEGSESFLNDLNSFLSESRENTGPVSETVGVLTQFLVSMAGPAKILKLGKLTFKGASVVRGALTGGIAGATGFSSDNPNAASVIQQLADGSENAEKLFSLLPVSIQTALRALPNLPDDSPMVARFKTFFAEAAFGVPFDVVMTGARVFRASQNAKKLVKENAVHDKNASFIKGRAIEKTPDLSDLEISVKKITNGLDEAIKAGDDEAVSKYSTELAELSGKNPEAYANAVENLEARGHGRDKLKNFGLPELRPDDPASIGINRNESTGLWDGAERFVEPVVIGGKKFNLSQIGMKFSKITDTNTLLKELSESIKRIDKELARLGFGSRGKRTRARDVFEKALKSLSDGREDALTTILAKAQATKKSGNLFGAGLTADEAVILKLVQASHGNETYRLMRQALKGNIKAAAELPKQLAIGAELEVLTRSIKSPLNKELLRHFDLSNLGFGRNFNQKATEMMARQAKYIADFDGFDLAVRLNAIQKKGQFRKLTLESSRPGSFDSFLEYHYNAIMSSLDSIVNNAFNSSFYLAYQVPTHYVAASLGKFGIGRRSFKSNLSGDSDNSVTFKAVNAGMHALYRAFRNNLRPLYGNLRAIAKLKDPPNLSFSRQKFEAYGEGRKAITAEANVPLINAVDKMVRFATQDAISAKSAAEFTINSVGRVMRTVQNLYGTFDEINKKMAYEFKRTVEAHSIIENSGLQGDEAIEKLRELIEDSSKNGPVHSSAMDMADHIAFTEKLDRLADAKNFLDEYPVFRLGFEFIRSQASIFSAYVANSPLAIRSPTFRAAMDAGGAEKQVALARLGMGTVLGWMIYNNWVTGDSTGSAPKNAKDRALLKALGWQENSIRISGDSWALNAVEQFSPTQNLVGQVVHVDDADTVTVRDSDGNDHEIRFKNVNADEKTQKLGPSSTAELKKMIANQYVTVEFKREDAFGRKVGTVFLDGKNINEAIVEVPGVEFKPNPPRYVSTKSMQPFSTWHATLVDSFEVWQKMKDPERKRNLFQLITEDIASNVLDDQFLNGVNMWLDAGRGGNEAEGVLSSMADALVPQIVKKSADVTAGVRRDFKTYDPTATPEHKLLQRMLRSFKATDPTLNTDRPHRDGFGREGHRPATTLGSYWNFPSVSMQAARNDSIVYQHFLENQFYKDSMEPRIMGVDLNDEEYADYTEFMEKVKNSKGQDFFVAARDMVKSSGFLKGTIGRNGKRHLMLESLYEQYKMRAQKAMMDKHPDLKARMRANAKIEADLLRKDDQPSSQFIDRSINTLNRNTPGVTNRSLSLELDQ